MNRISAIFFYRYTDHICKNLRAAIILPLLIACLAGLLATSGARAGEGGGSHYSPGTKGDVAPALFGPQGWYLRNELTYMDTSIGSVPLGNKVYANADQKIWLNTAKLMYLAESGIMGGRFGVVFSVPLVFDANVSGDVAGPVETERETSRIGLADISVAGLLNWKNGNFNHSVGLGVFAPTGSYDADRMVNLGRNYWSFNPSLAFTWLDPNRGHEISFTAGYQYNTENKTTDYKSGDELHVDFNLAQHFPAKFALGLTGYYYKQITSDNGPFLDSANRTLTALGMNSLGGFKGEAFGLGPIIKFTSKIGDRDINFIAKWLHDIHTTNRFKGDVFMLTMAFKL